MDGSWNIEEKTAIHRAFAILASVNNAYADNREMKARLQGWEAIMADEVSGYEVAEAVIKFAKKQDNIPTPSCLLKIINPVKQKISQSEFIHAKEQWRVEGYPAYSYYASIVKDFEKQEQSSREEKHDAPMHPRLAERLRKELGEAPKLKTITGKTS